MLCYNRRSWKKKKGSWRAACWGLYDCLSHSTAIKWGETVSFCLQHEPFTPGKRLEITVWSYGMYPKLVLMTESRDCLFFPAWTDPLSPSAPVRPSPCPGRVISDQRPVGSEDVLLKSGEGRWGRGGAFPNPSLLRHVSPPNEPGISGGFLPSNQRISGSILNGETVRSQPLYMRGKLFLLFLSGTTETNIGMNKCKDKSNWEGS